MNYIKTIELTKVFIHLQEKGLVILKFKDNIVLEKEDAKEVDQVIFDKLVKGKPFVVIVDARDVNSSISHEAREFFSKDELVLEIRKAHALVVNNLHTKILANFYIKFHKPINPIKIFSDFDEAYDWVKEINNNWNKKSS